MVKRNQARVPADAPTISPASERSGATIPNNSRSPNVSTNFR
jgi:hypothetical protein